MKIFAEIGVTAQKNYFILIDEHGNTLKTRELLKEVLTDDNDNNACRTYEGNIPYNSRVELKKKHVKVTVWVGGTSITLDNGVNHVISDKKFTLKLPRGIANADLLAKLSAFGNKIVSHLLDDILAFYHSQDIIRPVSVIAYDFNAN